MSRADRITLLVGGLCLGLWAFGLGFMWGLWP